MAGVFGRVGLPPEFDWVVGCSYVGLPVAAGPVRNLIGTDMSVRRHLMESVGGFREGFGNVVLDPSPDAKQTRLSNLRRDRLPYPRESRTSSGSLGYDLRRGLPSRAERSDNLQVLRGPVLARRQGEGPTRTAPGIRGRARLRSVRTQAVSCPVDWADLSDSARHRQLGGVLPAAVIVTGLATTATSYAVHQYRPRRLRPSLE